MKLLDSIKSSADVKALDKDQLPRLCSELRDTILDKVSKTGGHLASNLGAVELTVALHRVYDSSRDRLVFDVGHQCYVHKMLTGRLDRFDSLRSLGGLSGFPKPCESGDDACISGHASTSISNALGMARARTLLGESYDVVAVIGDGALTGGLAYEGLADCGESGEPIVVVLNDNAMSISENVGGMARLLSRLRVRQSYINFKKFYRRTVGRFKRLYKFMHVIKEWVKDLILPDNMFEDMGFYYLGPIDGHDIKTLTRTIRYARDMRVPVLVHIRTVKGKGYDPAEERPAIYHGVDSFDRVLGLVPTEKPGFSAAFGSALCAVAERNDRVAAITAAMAEGTGLTEFSKRFPGRFFDVGIAEEHAVSMAAGMAKSGLRPVFAVYSSFLQRSYDMLIHDVALSRLPVVFAVDRSGIVGADGETHQGSFDVGYLCQVPGMRVYSPSNYAELESMLSRALEHDGPTALRYPRGRQGSYTMDSSADDAVCVRHGDGVTVVTYGITVNEALAAAETLKSRGIEAEIIKLNRLDEIDYELIEASVRKTGRLVAAEETAERGCVGVRILARLESRGIPLVSQRLLNLGSGVVEHGAVEQLREKYAVDSGAIVSAAEGR